MSIEALWRGGEYKKVRAVFLRTGRLAGNLGKNQRLE